MNFDPAPLNLPSYPFKIKHEAGVDFIFDDIRKKFLVLTPEEWVRQHMDQYLIREKGVPRSLVKLEGGMKLNALQKRTDLLIFSREGEPLLLVECKAPKVAVTQAVFDQIARYNMVHKAEWLIVSNGLDHYCCRINFEENSYAFVPDIPAYTDLKNRSK